MKSKYAFLLAACIFLMSSAVFPGTDNDAPVENNMFKTPHILTIEYKSYHISDTEDIALYGAKIRKFVSPNWYWGEAGYGSVSGKRSGYLEGGLIGGYLGALSPGVVYDVRLFIGAGGGGAAPQGGGLIVNPTVGVGLHVSKQLFVCVEAGYIKFLNGDISSMTLGLNINMRYWEIFIHD